MHPDNRLGTRARLARASRIDGAVHQPGTIVDVVGMAPGRLRVRLPDGAEGYVTPSTIAAVDSPVRTLRITRPTPLASKASGGVRLMTLEPPARVSALGTFQSATFVRAPDGVHGWVQRD
jgi:hypothetical protein